MYLFKTFFGVSVLSSSKTGKSSEPKNIEFCKEMKSTARLNFH